MSAVLHKGSQGLMSRGDSSFRLGIGAQQQHPHTQGFGSARLDPYRFRVGGGSLFVRRMDLLPGQLGASGLQAICAVRSDDVMSELPPRLPVAAILGLRRVQCPGHPGIAEQTCHLSALGLCPPGYNRCWDSKLVFRRSTLVAALLVFCVSALLL